jgi:predicted TPR repeat methyltransferase
LPTAASSSRATGLYEQLEVEDMVVGLSGQGDASADLVLAADAFIYVGELAPVLTEVRRVLAPGGLLAFSVETHGGEGIVIGEGVRYAHAVEYLRNRIAASGLKLAYLEKASPRAEANEPVPGLVVVASKT